MNNDDFTNFTIGETYIMTDKGFVVLPDGYKPETIGTLTVENVDTDKKEITVSSEDPMRRIGL